jgi:MFS family permease
MTARPRGRVSILVVLALTNLMSYAARNALFAVYPALRARYHVSDADLGLLATVFVLPHALATLPFGWAGDRRDRRYVIAVGMILASAAGAAGALTASYRGLAVTRALVGLGTAAVVPVANSILGQVFDGPRKAGFMSIFNLGVLLGGVAGFAVGVILGFPIVVVALAVPGVLLAVILCAVPVPPHPNAPQLPPARVLAIASSASASMRRYAGDGLAIWQLARAFYRDARQLLRISTLRWLMASTTFMAFAAGAYNAWLKDYLNRDKGMSDAAASTLLAIALFGGLAGIPMGGALADRFRRRAANGRLWTIVIGMLATTPCAIAAILLPAGPLLYLAGIATLFFISWYHAPMAASVDDLAPAGLAVAAQGLVIFTMHLLGTSPSSWIVGAVSDASTLRTAMWVPTVSLVIAALCMARATRTFAADARREPAGGEPPAAVG